MRSTVVTMDDAKHRAVTADLKARTNCIEVARALGIVGERAVRVRGGLKVCCFVHTEKTPSCSIREQGWHCFGCETGGDAIDMIMRVLGCSFVEARQWLADYAGVSLITETAAQRRARAEAQRRASAVAVDAAVWARGMSILLTQEYTKHLDESEFAESDADIAQQTDAITERLCGLLYAVSGSDPALLMRTYREHVESSPDTTRMVTEYGRSDLEEATQLGRAVVHWMAEANAGRFGVIDGGKAVA